jgi:hypothetical protein
MNAKEAQELYLDYLKNNGLDDSYPTEDSLDRERESKYREESLDWRDYRYCLDCQP